MAPTADTPAPPATLLVLSAHTPTALAAQARQLAAHWPDAPLADIAYTAAVGRAALPQRLALVAAQRADAQERWRPSPATVRPRKSSPDRRSETAPWRCYSPVKAARIGRGTRPGGAQPHVSRAVERDARRGRRLLARRSAPRAVGRRRRLAPRGRATGAGGAADRAGTLLARGRPGAPPAAGPQPGRIRGRLPGRRADPGRHAAAGRACAQRWHARSLQLAARRSRPLEAFRQVAEQQSPTSVPSGPMCRASPAPGPRTKWPRPTTGVATCGTRSVSTMRCDVRARRGTGRVPGSGRRQHVGRAGPQHAAATPRRACCPDCGGTTGNGRNT